MYLNVPVIYSMANLSVIQYTNEKWSLLLKVTHWWQRSYGVYKCQSSARTNRKRQIYIVVCPWMLKVNNILQEGSPRPAIKCRVLGKQYNAIICKLLGIFICIYYFLCHLYPILLCTFLSFSPFTWLLLLIFFLLYLQLGKRNWLLLLLLLRTVSASCCCCCCSIYLAVAEQSCQLALQFHKTNE